MRPRKIKIMVGVKTSMVWSDVNLRKCYDSSWVKNSNQNKCYKAQGFKYPVTIYLDALCIEILLSRVSEKESL